MVFPQKLLLGSVVAGTGVGVGGVVLISSRSKNTEFKTKEAIQLEVSPVKKWCRIHKLMSSAGSGSFQKIEKEELRKEIIEAKKGDYLQIESACDKAEDKDIFVSNKAGTGWKYYDEDQEESSYKSKFENYLKSQTTPSA